MNSVRSIIVIPASGPGLVLMGFPSRIAVGEEITAWRERGKWWRNTRMQLHLSTWPEIEVYLASSKAILIPIGSTEQHGPNGLLGTDALCPEVIAKRAGDEAG